MVYVAFYAHLKFRSTIYDLSKKEKTKLNSIHNYSRIICLF
jgi:hypothetical protein